MSDNKLDRNPKDEVDPDLVRGGPQDILDIESYSSEEDLSPEEFIEDAIDTLSDLSAEISILQDAVDSKRRDIARQTMVYQWVDALEEVYNANGVDAYNKQIIVYSNTLQGEEKLAFDETFNNYLQKQSPEDDLREIRERLDKTQRKFRIKLSELEETKLARVSTLVEFTEELKEDISGELSFLVEELGIDGNIHSIFNMVVAEDVYSPGDLELEGIRNRQPEGRWTLAEAQREQNTTPTQEQSGRSLP